LTVRQRVRAQQPDQGDRRAVGIGRHPGGCARCTTGLPVLAQVRESAPGTVAQPRTGPATRRDSTAGRGGAALHRPSPPRRNAATWPAASPHDVAPRCPRPLATGAGRAATAGLAGDPDVIRREGDLGVPVRRGPAPSAGTARAPVSPAHRTRPALLGPTGSTAGRDVSTARRDLRHGRRHRGTDVGTPSAPQQPAAGTTCGPGICSTSAWSASSRSRRGATSSPADASAVGCSNPDFRRHAWWAYAVVLGMVYWTPNPRCPADDALDGTDAALRADDRTPSSTPERRVRLVGGSTTRPSLRTRRALLLNPTFATAHCGLGDSLCYEGRTTRRWRVPRAVELGSHDPSVGLHTYGAWPWCSRSGTTRRSAGRAASSSPLPVLDHRPPDGGPREHRPRATRPRWCRTAPPVSAVLPRLRRSESSTSSARAAQPVPHGLRKPGPRIRPHCGAHCRVSRTRDGSIEGPGPIPGLRAWGSTSRCGRRSPVAPVRSEMNEYGLRSSPRPADPPLHRRLVFVLCAAPPMRRPQLALHTMLSASAYSVTMTAREPQPGRSTRPPREHPPLSGDRFTTPLDMTTSSWRPGRASSSIRPA